MTKISCFSCLDTKLSWSDEKGRDLRWLLHGQLLSYLHRQDLEKKHNFLILPYLPPPSPPSPSLQVLYPNTPLSFSMKMYTEWERPKPGRRPDIFPQFSPMKTPLPTPMPADPPEEDEDEEEKKEEEEEDPEKEEQDNPEK